MPPIRALSSVPAAMRITDASRDKVIARADIPAGEDTPAKVEAYLAAQFASPDYQVAVHVDPIDPAVVSITVANLGVIIPPTWWDPDAKGP